MSPDPDNNHVGIRDAIYLALHFAVQGRELGRVATGANVSDRDEGWVQNYRIPDLIVYLNTNPARDRDTHYVGGPDFALEVVSPGEDGTAKLDFYAAVGTREVLVIDRDPWALTLYRLENGQSLPAQSGSLVTSQLGVTVALDTTGPRTAVVATTPDGRAFRA